MAERIPLLHARDVTRSIEWFQRHGRTAVFVGRLVPGVRSLISIPAGIDRMPVLQFAGYTAAGSLLWNAVLIGAGYELGSRWHVVERYVGNVSTVAYVLIGLALTAFVVRRIRRRRAARSDPRPGSPTGRRRRPPAAGRSSHP